MKVNPQKVLIIAIFLLGLFFRLSPGKDNFIWNDIDTSRDYFLINSMIRDRNLVILGPKSERGLIYHGPLYYYLMAPLYYLSNGDPNLPVIGLIILNLSTLIPLYLLAKKLFVKNNSVFILLFLFSISYEQIEYSRWLLNPSSAIPFLAWTAYFAWGLIERKPKCLLMGISLGLASQSQIFLSYLTVYLLGLMIVVKSKFNQYLRFTLGICIGLLPIIVSEFKFKFRASQTLISDVFGGDEYKISFLQSISKYASHMGMTAKNAIFALPNNTSLGLLLVSIVVIVILILKKSIKPNRAIFILGWLLANFVLYRESVDTVFLDVGIGIAMLFLFTMILDQLIIVKKTALVTALLFTISVLQIIHLQSQAKNYSPFSKYGFHKTSAATLKEKIQIAQQVYMLSAYSSDISIAVLDTPYGSRTEWAAVFQILSRRNNQPLPKWFGFHSNGGFGGDDVLVAQDFPAKYHFVLKPRNLIVDDSGIQHFYQEQNRVSKIVDTKIINDFELEIRSPAIQSTN